MSLINLIPLVPIALYGIHLALEHYESDVDRFMRQNKNLTARQMSDVLRMRESVSRITRRASEAALANPASALQTIETEKALEIERYRDRPDLLPILNEALCLPYGDFLSAEAMKVVQKEMATQTRVLAAIVGNPDIDQRNAFRVR